VPLAALTRNNMQLRRFQPPQPGRPAEVPSQAAWLTMNAIEAKLAAKKEKQEKALTSSARLYNQKLCCPIRNFWAAIGNCRQRLQSTTAEHSIRNCPDFNQQLSGFLCLTCVHSCRFDCFRVFDVGQRGSSWCRTPVDHNCQVPCRPSVSFLGFFLSIGSCLTLPNVA
jgi:hypothetical protein